MDKEIVKKTIWRNNRRVKELDGPFLLMDEKYVIKITNINSKNKDILGDYHFLAVVCSIEGFTKVRFLARQDAPKLLDKDQKTPYINSFFTFIHS